MLCLAHASFNLFLDLLLFSRLLLLHDNEVFDLTIVSILPPAVGSVYIYVFEYIWYTQMYIRA